MQTSERCLGYRSFTCIPRLKSKGVEAPQTQNSLFVGSLTTALLFLATRGRAALHRSYKRGVREKLACNLLCCLSGGVDCRSFSSLFFIVLTYTAPSRKKRHYTTRDNLKGRKRKLGTPLGVNQRDTR